MVDTQVSLIGGENEKACLYRPIGHPVLFHHRLPGQGGNGGAGEV
jgi:hypothetical protein